MRFPVFVIEGPDSAGKTTLANKLAKMTNAKIIHATYRFKGRMGLYHWAILRKAIRMSEHSPVIIDRWWPSEVVYGNTYRNGPEPDYSWEELHEWALKLGFSYTIAAPFDWDSFWTFLQENYHNQDQLYKLDKNRINNIWYLYREMALDWKWKLPRDGLFHRYDVTLPLWRTNMFPKHILDGWKSWASHRRTAEQQTAMKTVNWRDVRPANLKGTKNEQCK